MFERVGKVREPPSLQGCVAVAPPTQISKNGQSRCNMRAKRSAKSGKSAHFSKAARREPRAAWRRGVRFENARTS
jgi:hypothetical protein